MGRTGEADYIVTGEYKMKQRYGTEFHNDLMLFLFSGTWSHLAAEEAKKYGKVNNVLNLEKGKELPDRSEWKLSPNASYVYYCANETIEGI